MMRGGGLEVLEILAEQVSPTPTPLMPGCGVRPNVELVGSWWHGTRAVLLIPFVPPIPHCAVQSPFQGTKWKFLAAT